MSRKRVWTGEEEEELVRFLTDSDTVKRIAKLPKIGDTKHSVTDIRAKLQSLLSSQEGSKRESAKATPSRRKPKATRDKAEEEEQGEEEEPESPEEQQAEEEGPPKRKAGKAPASAEELNVPANRRDEIRRYLELFGYEPGHTILQVHEAGKYGHTMPYEHRATQTELTKERYGGTVLVVVGRVHDPGVKSVVAAPRRGGGGATYVGYLSKGSSQKGLAPHESIPLDFVPQSMKYPEAWHKKFNTRGYLVTMYVPVSFAPLKNELMRHIRAAASKADAQEPWTWLDELRPFGVERVDRGGKAGKSGKSGKSAAKPAARPRARRRGNELEPATQSDQTSAETKAETQRDEGDAELSPGFVQAS